MQAGKAVPRYLDWLCLGVMLLSGAASLLLMREVYLRVAAPRLYLALKAVEQGGERRLAIRFINTGRSELALDLEDLEYFAYVPDPAQREYFVQVRPAAHREGAEPALLRPGEEIVLGNLLPLLNGLPAGEALLRVVYTAEARAGDRPGWWRGVAVSMPVALELTKD